MLEQERDKRVFKNGKYELDYNSEYDVLNRQLQTLLDYYNIQTNKAHRADSDALATGYLFLEFMEEKRNQN